MEEQNGELFGLSPFRAENTPSFSITPSTQLFYDFSSGTGGNIITFIQKYHKCNFTTAINLLKQFANITEEYTDQRLAATKIIKKYKSSAERKKKDTTVKSLELDIMNKYEKDIDKLQTWVDEGISYEVMDKYQVRYDSFSNRIVFPIRDINGTIISIKGRTLDNDYKTKKLRKYTYFQKIGDLDILFGYYEHKVAYLNDKEIILFEGEKSVMLAETWGVTNTAAILTSHLNPLQVPMLIKLGVRVVFALDEDIDITTDDNIKKLCRFLKVEYIHNESGLLQSKMSPVDAGITVWKQLYEGRKSLN